MIQFNLLPQVKIEHIRTQKIKRLVMVAAVACVGVSAGILILLFSYSAVQKRHISNLDRDIAAMQAELESNSELAGILSVQGQLNSLPALYDGRPAVERIPLFIDQTTPVDVGLGRFSIDFSESTIELSGTALSLSAVNAYVDALKLTKFTVGEDSQSEPAFTGVVLSQFGRDDSEASFTISMSFNPVIFDSTRDVSLAVSNSVTTRGQSNPSDLFDGSTLGGENAE